MISTAFSTVSGHRRSGSPRRIACEGATLVEVLIAMLLLAVGYVGISTTCSTCISIVRNQRETMASAQLLQERVEQLQAAGWTQLTNAAALSQGVFAIPSPQTAYLEDAHEVVEITTYPPVSPAATPLKVERRGGKTNILSLPPGGLSLRQIVALRVDLHVDWKSANQRRQRTRELSTVIALGGLLQ